MSENIEYATRRFKMGALSPMVREEQRHTLAVLENLDNTRLIDTVYLQVFAADEEELLEVGREIRQAQSADFRINTMTLTQKIKFLFRRYNIYRQYSTDGRDSPAFFERVTNKQWLYSNVEFNHLSPKEQPKFLG